MTDLTMGDAIQALNEVSQGMEIVNDRDQFSDLCLTPDLERAIASLATLGMSIILQVSSESPCEDKMAAQQDGHDISEVA
jgi:hypothetical protein